MPPKAYMNRENWMYHFLRCYHAALEGEHLPTLEELYCGMPFLNDSMPHDVKAWSERAIPRLAERGQKVRRNSLQIAIEHLRVRSSLEDLKFVYNEIMGYDISSHMSTEIEHAARRLVFYRVFSGDESASPLLFRDLMFKIRSLTYESAGLRRRTP